MISFMGNKLVHMVDEDDCWWFVVFVAAGSNSHFALYQHYITIDSNQSYNMLSIYLMLHVSEIDLVQACND